MQDVGGLVHLHHEGGLAAGDVVRRADGLSEEEKQFLISELRRAFEQMRVSLQARLDELNRLLAASQGVASSLKFLRRTPWARQQVEALYLAGEKPANPA